MTAAPAAGSEQVLLERHDGFTFEWGSNGATHINSNPNIHGSMQMWWPLGRHTWGQC